MLGNMCKQLRKHIYTERMQWNTHVQARENLYYDTFISIEDYQTNMEVMYSQNPTSFAYSAHKLTVAMYSICTEFKSTDGTIAKDVITFLSEDKENSHQQIQQFEHRMFEIVREKLHCPLNHWIRYSGVWSPVQVRICCCRHAACNRKLPGEKCIIQLF